MADRGPSPWRYVASLDTIARGDVARAGGKGANLGELIRAGHRVPRGFVVTTDAYAAALDDVAFASRTTGSRRDDRSHAGSDVDGAAIRADVAGAAVPDEVRSAIVEAYTALGDGPVAVRSSATVEDLVGAAFAGQHDTYLDIAGADEVIDAVRRCWASLWSDRAIAYRRRRGVSAAGARMAVVVQAMVAADIAGVMFTADPVTGARDEIVVDAGSGRGEAVASGVVTPDHYVLDARGQVRRWQPGQRERVGQPSSDDVAGASAPAGMRRLPVDTRVELARVGRDVAGHFGQPQDIEWAWAHGRLWLLQARPMTALPPPPVPLNRLQRVTGPPLLEMLPVRPFPLDMSAWLVPGPGRMVGRMLQEMIGVRVDLSKVLPERQEVVDRFVPPAPRPTLGLLTAPARDVGRIRRFDPAVWTRDARFAAYRRQIAALAARDPTTLPWAELVSLPRQALDALDVVTDLRIDYLPRAAVALVRLRLALRLLGLGELFPLLITGAPTRTGDANRALADLAAKVRTDDTLRALFTEADADDPAARLRRACGVDDFGVALDAFLNEYGHRETTSILLLSSPTWSEAPAVVFGAIRALVDQATRPASDDRRDRALRRLLEHPVVRGTRSQGRVTRMVRSARAGIALREDTHFHATSVLPILRSAVQEMGRRLADAGVLDDAELVFHLRLAELEGATDPQGAPDEAAEQHRETVQRRADVRAQRAGAPLISRAALFPEAAGDAGIVSGAAASGGRTTGPVRVVREPAEFGRLREGDILVCPYTNPAWTSLFQRAAAVVVDTGGLASHAAIVAREYGIPAVMGTGTATTALTDGQIVTVDGDRGRVDAADADGTAGDTRATADHSHDETRAMYDRIAGIYQLVEGAWEHTAIMRGLALLDARPGESVLEVGCGPGAALVRLARAVQPGGRAVGVDLSTRMCRIARRRIRRAHLTTVASVDTCDATRLPFPAGSFDACFMSFTLELFATPEIPAVLAEIARVLRVGGRIGIVALTKDGPDSRGRRLYEWGHHQLPRLLDCRPIHVSSKLARAGLQPTTTQRMSLWGLPVDAIVAVNRGNVSTPTVV